MLDNSAQVEIPNRALTDEAPVYHRPMSRPEYLDEVQTLNLDALAPRDSAVPLEANDYQRTKVAADRAAEEALRNGSPLMRVYPGVVYGPGALTSRPRRLQRTRRKYSCRL